MTHVIRFARPPPPRRLCAGREGTPLPLGRRPRIAPPGGPPCPPHREGSGGRPHPRAVCPQARPIGGLLPRARHRGLRLLHVPLGRRRRSVSGGTARHPRPRAQTCPRPRPPVRGAVSGRGHDCAGAHGRPPGHAPATVGDRPAAVDGPRAVLADGRRVRPPAHVRTRRTGPARARRCGRGLGHGANERAAGRGRGGGGGGGGPGRAAGTKGGAAGGGGGMENPQEAGRQDARACGRAGGRSVRAPVGARQAPAVTRQPSAANRPPPGGRW